MPDEFGDHYVIVIPTNFITQVWRNISAVTNTPPSAPTGLSAITSGGTVTFNWNASSDAQTPSSGLSYNLRIGTSPGVGDLVSANSTSTGQRLLPDAGNAGHRLSRTIAGLPVGQAFYWNVQAVDSAFAGSSFAVERTFTYNTVPAATNGIVIPGDINGEGVVDQAEFAIVLQHLNGTGTVTESDLSLVLSNYLPHAILYLANVAGWAVKTSASPSPTPWPARSAWNARPIFWTGGSSGLRYRATISVTRTRPQPRTFIIGYAGRKRVALYQEQGVAAEKKQREGPGRK